MSGNSSSLLHVASAREAHWGGRIHIRGGLSHGLQRGGLIGWELSRSCWLGPQFTSIEPSTKLLSLPCTAALRDDQISDRAIGFCQNTE